MKDFDEFDDPEMDDSEKNNDDDDINSRIDGETRVNRDEEIRRMSEEADKANARQLDFFSELPKYEDEEVKEFFGNMQNPSESHRLYYAIRKILMSYLPQGRENKPLRDMIYEQKNIFLTQGKHKDSNGIRHGDGRQALIDTELVVALDKVKRWAINGAQTFDIYLAFRELNIQRGYVEEV